MLTFGTVVGNRTPSGRRVWQRYWDNSVAVPGPETEKLGAAAAEAGAYLALGVIERDSDTSGGTLFCTLFPCQSCAKLLMQAGIEAVVAEYDYHSSGPSKALFDAVGISHKVIRPGAAYVP